MEYPDKRPQGTRAAVGALAKHTAPTAFGIQLPIVHNFRFSPTSLPLRIKITLLSSRIVAALFGDCFFFCLGQ